MELGNKLKYKTTTILGDRVVDYTIRNRVYHSVYNSMYDSIVVEHFNQVDKVDLHQIRREVWN